MVALTYLNYVDENKKGPTTVDEFLKYAKEKSESAPYVNYIKTGKYVFYMGVNTDQNPEKRGDIVLGYESEVPQSGGLVAMADGRVRQMTAKEFAAAIKPAGAQLSKP